jgi:hypothetical protein
LNIAYLKKTYESDSTIQALETFLSDGGSPCRVSNY